MSIAVRDNGDVYVACYHGDIYRYTGGDPARRKLFLSFGRTLSTPVIRFDLDFGRLFLTSSNKGNLVSIDPDQATWTAVLPDGTFSSPVSLEVAGERRDVGLWRYGRGLAGKGGIVPTLDAKGHPVFGETLTLKLRDFIGGATATIVADFAGTHYPSLTGTPPLGLADDSWLIPVQLLGDPAIAGSGHANWSETVPADPALDGTVWRFTAFAPDPDARDGFSLTNSMRITFRSF